MPTMVRTVRQQRDEFWYLSAGGRESCFICVAGACVPNPRTPVNDFPGSAAFFCLRKLWRWAIMLITDHLSTGFQFCRFLLFGRLMDRPSFILECSAGIKITSANVHFFLFCSDYKRQVSARTRQRDCQPSLTLSIGSTPAMLIGPVEACRLSGANTSMPGSHGSSGLDLKPSGNWPRQHGDPESCCTKQWGGGIRVLVREWGVKVLQLSSNCIWHLQKS